MTDFKKSVPTENGGWWSGDRFLPDFVGDAVNKTASRFLIKGLTEDIQTGSNSLFADILSFGGSKPSTFLTLEDATEDGFKASVWVYVCCRKLATSAASVQFEMQTRTDGDSWESVPEHQFNTVIKSPNKHMSWMDLMETLVYHLYLAGNAFVVIGSDESRGSGEPGNPLLLHLINPDHVKVRLDSDGFVSKYDYFRDKGKMKIPGSTPSKSYDARQIIHLMFIDPNNPNWGVSPLVAGVATVDSDIAAVEFNRSTLKNQGIPTGILSIDGAEMEDKEDYDLAKLFARRVIDGPENAGKTLVLNASAKYDRLSTSALEMAYIDGSKLTANSICALLGVNQLVAGIMEKANMSNMKVARFYFWEDTVIPLIKDILDAFNHRLRLFWDSDDVRLWFDTSDIQALQVALAEKIETATGLFGMGVAFSIVNESLKLGLPRFAGDDIGYLPANLISTSFDTSGINEPVDLTVPQDPEPVVEDPEEGVVE